MTDNRDSFDASEQLSQLQSDYQTLSIDHEDLLMMLNDQDEEIQDLKNRLRGYGEEFPDDQLEEDEEIIDLQH